MTKRLLSTSPLLALALTAALVQPALSDDSRGNMDIAASVGVANTYLFRGMDLGQGEAAVFGDVSVGAAGFYGTVWATSGDAELGTEYDVMLGYQGQQGEFFYDLALMSYVYPNEPTDIGLGDFMEAALTVGYGPISATYVDNIEAGDPVTEDYSYYSLGAAFGSFRVITGIHDNKFGPDPVHVDISYDYNDRLSFTASKMVSDAALIENNAHFVVSYKLPLE